MHGIHDLGGMHGFGPIDVHEDPHDHFPEPWQRPLFGLVLAMGASGLWNIDMARAARETMPAADYLASGYYDHWWHGLVALLLEKGVVTPAELAAATPPADPAPASAPRVLHPDQVPAVLAKGATARREPAGPPQFRPGDRVRVRNARPPGHTRTPRYCLGKVGEIALHHGAFVFPDSAAATGDPDPQHCYAVRFTAAELFGPDGDPKAEVMIDLWDPYLLPAAEGGRG